MAAMVDALWKMNVAPPLAMKQIGGIPCLYLAGRNDNDFWANITPGNQFAANRWAYDFEEWEKVRPGTDDDCWAVKQSGRASTGTVKAYNVLEWGNTATGFQTSQIDLSNIPANYTLQPIQAKAGKLCIVRMTYMPAANEYLFAVQNALSGGCEQ